MDALKVIPLSKIKIGKKSIKFEKQQLKLYKKLVKKHPKNEYYKRTQLELARQLEEDKDLLKAESCHKPHS